MLGHEPLFIPSLQLCSELDPFIGTPDDLIVVVQALSLKYPDIECCHPRKYVQPPSLL